MGLMQPHLSREKMDRDLALVEPNQPIDDVWFPEDGIVSIIAQMPAFGATEVGIFGRDGFSGTCLLLGSDLSPHGAYVQVAGGAGLRIKADCLLAAVNQSPTLRAALLRYIQTFMTQTAYSAVSKAHQRIEGRLARWLLMCHDRIDGDEIALTHETMAMMISADRSSVTITLHVLEGAGMLRSRRGRVLITDRYKLEEAAGENYGRPEAEYRKLIGPLGRARHCVTTTAQGAGMADSQAPERMTVYIP